MFKEMKTGTRIAIAFTAVFLLVAALAATSYYDTRKLGALVAVFSKEKLPTNTLLWTVRQSETAVRANSAPLTKASSRTVREEARKRVASALKRVEDGTAEYSQLPKSAETQALWSEYLRLHEKWKQSVKALLAAVDQRDANDGAPQGQIVELDAAVDNAYLALVEVGTPVMAQIGKVIDQTAEEGKALTKEAARLERRTAVLLSVVVAVIAALLGLVAVLLARSVLTAIRGILGETHRITKAVEAGELAVRGDAGAVTAEFRPVLVGVNATLDAFASRIQVTAEYVERIGKGDLPPPITDQYEGDFNRIKDSLNGCIGALSGLIAEMNRMSAEHDRGEIDATIDPSRFQGAYAQVAAGVNAMVAGHVEVNGKAMACVAEFGKGNFDAPLEKFPGKKASINETVEKVRANVKRFIAEMNRMSAEHDRGEIDVAIDAPRFEGDFRVMADGVNAMVAGHVALMRKAMACVAEFGEGNFEASLERFPGKKASINETVERVRASLKSVIADVDGLARAAVAGKLSVRADAARHRNDFRKIVQGVNETLDAILGPINDATVVLEKLAQRDLRARVDGSYQGDHARIKEALNATAGALHEALGQVAEAVAQVSSAAGQIAASSQAVADGASEQASSLQETSSSLVSMSTMTKQSADNAQQANGLAQTARAAAAEGATAMEQMTGAMGKIKAAAEGTSQIIRDINEIAFQTNLLALNAAVEAARAGDAGRGFAVVAEEVRSLALRSKEAAMKTEQLIRESVNQAGEGATTALHVNSKLGEIAGSVAKVTDIIAEMAAAAKEQAVGIDQVTKAVGQMDKVTQQNAANSEESSSAAAELSGQSEELAAMVGTFQIEREAAAAVTSAGERKAAHRRAGSPVNTAAAASRPGAKNGKNGSAAMALRPEDVIPLAGDGALAEF